MIAPPGAARHLRAGGCVAASQTREISRVPIHGILASCVSAYNTPVRAAEAAARTKPPKRALMTKVGGAWEIRMIKWAIIFFIISVIAGFLGFTGVASGARTIAKVLFFIALTIFLIVLIFGVMLGMLVF
jgi:uncharacterized membrane protein YtjA (UPF0391 family)